MNKFKTVVGFYDGDEEYRPGTFRQKIVEREYYGELTRNYNLRWQGGDGQNDNINLSQNVSILSDAYAHEHWPAIRYITFNGVRWSVSNVEVNYPRLTFELGGVYNGVNGPSSTT